MQIITSSQKGNDLVKTVIDKLQDHLSSEMTKVDKLMRERMRSDKVDLIEQIAGHLINAGGKRIRPLLTISSAKLFNYEGDNHIKLAAVVEFIHNATLLHDDVVDGSDRRRNKLTANSLWDNKSSILVGDFLFSKSFQLMIETKSSRVLSILANSSGMISEGEVLQLSTARNLNTSQEIYYDVIRGKTAALFSASCQTGSYVSGAKKKYVDSLYLYGDALGICFQIMDDLLDYRGKDRSLGKNVGNDFKERKVTLPLILAYKDASHEERKFWERTIMVGDQKKDDFNVALKILNDKDIFEKTYAIASNWSHLARQNLKSIPESTTKDLLEELCSYVISRVS